MTTIKHVILTTAAASLAASLAVAAQAAEKWDMPMAYSATNFHSATGAEFAKCITTGTGGEIEVVTHPSGSLFKGGDIKRAIQTGQVPIGERLRNHLRGYKAARVVTRYGRRLRPELYRGLNPLAYQQALEVEVKLAETLRTQGLVVFGGH